jgi:hypothetical protein
MILCFGDVDGIVDHISFHSGHPHNPSSQNDQGLVFSLYKIYNSIQHQKATGSEGVRAGE